MPTIKQIKVINQTETKDVLDSGQETCGVHALKNALLFLLCQKKIISLKSRNALMNDADFFNSFNAMMAEKAERNQEALPSDLFQIAQLIEKEGLNLKKYGFNFSKYEDVDENSFKNLQLTANGNQSISYTNFTGHVPNEEFGSQAFDEQLDDLFVALATAKFLKKPGAGSHIFAIGGPKFGMTGHWVNIIVNKNAQNKLSYEYMDSWYNDTTFAPNLITKMAKVLNKSPEELNTYLLTAYDNATHQLNDHFSRTFEVQNGESTLIDFAQAKNDFIKIDHFRSRYIKNIPQLLSFMKQSNWLTDGGKKELQKMKQLNSIVIFMLDNAEDPASYYAELRQKFEPIKSELSEAITNLEKKLEITVEDIQEEATTNTISTSAIAAIDAHENQTPKAGPTFANRFVNVIKYMIERITNVFNSVLTAIGIRAR